MPKAQDRFNRVRWTIQPCWIVSVAICSLVTVSVPAQGQTLFEADFDDGKVPESLVERFPKMEARDGFLAVTQGAKHAASPTLLIPFTDGSLRFRLRLNPSVEFFTCRFEDASRVEGAQSHLCRLEIRSTGVSLKLDRPPKDREYREAAVLATGEAALLDNEWHDVTIRFRESTVSVTIDENISLSGTHPHLGQEKIGTFFVLRKGEAHLDDLVLNASDEMEISSNDLEQSLTIFHDYVEPVLKKSCYECHSHEAKKAKGGLVVDSLNPMLKGGDLGPALVPGDAAASLLYEAIDYHNDDLQMPPDAKLDPLEIGKIREWIDLGAAHPRTGPALEENEYSGPRPDELWSVQPFAEAKVPVPNKLAWGKNSIDQFLLAAMEERGLAPSPDAAPHAVLRRLHYVLTGLPPTVEDAAEFSEAAQENFDTAISAKVDELLASRHFGERWGRHWLDVARYADVNGATNPAAYPEAWRYREWAVHSFNEDKPWDEFVREQLAGDLLDADKPAERIENLIGTGFLALPHVLAVDRDRERLKLDTIDEQLDVIGKTFLGIQIGCARCHDHKIDPLPTADYYAMAGILRSTRSVKPSKSLETLESAGAELEGKGKGLPVWMKGKKGVKLHSVSDESTPRDEPIHLRGEPEMLGEVVPRGFPTLVAMESGIEIPGQASGRAELAEWILAAENVLSARVIVNRVWHHVFGQGLVRTTDNFGLTGDPPSHPELLDFLALRFQNEHGHSFKSLIRELVTSRAFRQESRARDDGFAIDPENRLFWRSHPRRSDAESLVDSIQFIAGTIDLASAPGTVPEFERGNQASTSNLEIPKSTLRKRALYWPVFRKDVPIAMDILGIFDFPPSTSPRGRRAATRVPSQSLALLNSSLVLNAARSLAGSLPEADDGARLAYLYQKVLARSPSRSETESALDFLDSFAGGLAEADAAKPKNVRNVAWNRLCHTLLASNEFITVP